FLPLGGGEMAPQVGAFTDPGPSAILLALPFQACARVSRPVLTGLNAVANAFLRLFRVQPQDQLAQVHGPEELSLLLEASHEHGLLPADQHAMLANMLQLQRTTVGELMKEIDQLVTVRADDTPDRIEQVSRDSGRSRIGVLDSTGTLVGVVHVREAVRASTMGRRVTAADLMSPRFTVPVTATVAEGVAAMRANRVQLALVTNGAGDDQPVGFVALEDLLEEVIGEFNDETDPRTTR
ncbi:MAG: hypothetical protein DIU79_13345, partial [Actinobacteria bacterium]